MTVQKLKGTVNTADTVAPEFGRVYEFRGWHTQTVGSGNIWFAEIGAPEDQEMKTGIRESPFTRIMQVGQHIVFVYGEMNANRRIYPTVRQATPFELLAQRKRESSKNCRSGSNSSKSS